MDLLTTKHLDPMKASYLALQMVNHLALHLGLMIESHLGLIIEAHLELMMDMSWVFLVTHLIVPMTGNPWVHCLVFRLDNILELSWFLLVLLSMVIKMA